MSTALPQRARSEEQKEKRRESILRAAAILFSDVGFEKFSMSALGQRSGVAKGTLYLYFESREEVLLSLVLAKLERWLERLREDEWKSDEDFVQTYYATLNDDPELVQLISRLDTVIEHNVSLKVLIEAKRHMALLIDSLSQTMAAKMALTMDQALDANRSIAALFIGAVQGDLGPKLDQHELPEDVRQLTELFSSKQLFHTNACRIIQGIRSEQTQANKR